MIKESVARDICLWFTTGRTKNCRFPHNLVWACRMSRCCANFLFNLYFGMFSLVAGAYAHKIKSNFGMSDDLSP
jgi:hypothetical protein